MQKQIEQSFLYIELLQNKDVDADSQLYSLPTFQSTSYRESHVLCTINKNYREQIICTSQNHRHSF